MAGEKFLEYLDAVRKPFIKLCRLRFLNPDGTTAFALDNNPVKEINRTFIANGNLSVNLQNGQRRTCNVTLDNVNGDFDFSLGHIWFGDEVAVDEGMILPSGEDFYIQQGVFVFDPSQESVTPNGRTMEYTLVDKWSNLDGSRMGNLEGTYEVPVGTNIFTPISSLLAEDRGNGQPLDHVTPIYTEYYNNLTQTVNGQEVSLVLAPHTLTVEGGSTKADVILGLVGMVNGWVGYDPSGALRVDPSQDDIEDESKPVQWIFSQQETTLLGMTYTANAKDVYNDYIVVGAQLENGSQPKARVQNYDPKSDTNIDLIGRKTFREEQSGFSTNTMCKDYARWKVKRSSVLQKTVSISCSQILHLTENNLVEIQRTDKAGSPVERHLIQGFSRPLIGNSPMTVDAISVFDFPQLRTTVGNITE